MRRALFVACAMWIACVDTNVSRDLGARCEVLDECEDRCLAPAPEFPGGFCTLDCQTDDDCPSSALCIAAEGGVCVFGCREDAGCEFLGVGWTCQLEDARTGGEVRVCIGND